MKKVLALLAVVVTLGLSTVALDAEAKRLGGGKSSGMQRQQNTSAPANQPGAGNTTQSGQQAAPAGAAAAAPGAAAAAAPKRSWMGPVAGLAAGLGLAALASHFGFGEALANMMMIGLLIMAVLLVVGFIMRKRAAANGGALAGAGAGAAGAFQRPQAQDAAYRMAEPQPAQRGSLIGSRIGSGLGSAFGGTQVGAIPADFDAVGFAGNAKTQFLALQAANDTGDYDRLRQYLSPEMFEAVRADIAERGGATQHTEVFGLNAQVLSVVEEPIQYVASVRFTGSVRDQHGAAPDELDEVWHLTKPRAGQGGWVIAGIQQTEGGSTAA
jgi:predicted lipid-binding transport protein (Tim44 family)